MHLSSRMLIGQGTGRMSRIVGIDLGTTNSLCTVFLDGEPRLIPNAHGGVLTPSVVGILEDGQVVVGDPAKELRVTRPERTASCFKRLMGTSRSVQLAGRTLSAPELSSLVLRALKEDAEAWLGEAVTDAVITVPAYFNDNQRKATRTAGEIAGLTVRRIVNEPTAAALTYGFHDRQSEKQIIVIDLGGGTFDVTLMEIFEGTLEIISTSGESFLGGEDFTDRIAGQVLRKQGLVLETAELKQPLRVARLRQECEAAKRALFNGEKATIRVPGETGELGDAPPTVTLTRKNFAAATEELVKRLAKPIGKALRDGRCGPEQVDDVILVGGATRMPVVREFVERYFGKTPLSTFNPDEVVALGAAVQAALMADDRAVGDMVMTDVCPFTLGVDVAKEFGRRIVGGYFQPIIHRNTTIPVSREEVFYTVSANQREVQVGIYQGEGRKVEDNLKLGDLSVTGIPPGPRGMPVHVRFTYDINGILEVEAYVPDSGRKFRTVLKQHAKGLSNEDLEEALRNMQQLKFYPRDDVRNQRLVLFCERLVGEIGPYERDELEQAIDVFESAMTAGDRELFEHARVGLLMTLSRLGIEYDEESHDSAGEEQA